MRQISLRAAFFVLLMGALSACGLNAKVTSHNPHAVYMNAGQFLSDHITISAGNTIDFVNNADTGALHILSVGTNGDLHNEPGAPNFSGTAGVRVDQGALWTSPPWKTAGTYHITCTVHPMMNLTVTVLAATTPTPTP